MKHISSSSACLLFSGAGWLLPSSDGRAAGTLPPGHAFVLDEPAFVWADEDPMSLPAALTELEQALAAGYLGAGFVCYEAAQSFGLPTHAPWRRTPAYWFGLFDSHACPRLLGPEELARLAPGAYSSAAGACLAIPEMSLNISRTEYLAALAAIKEFIAAGDTYQVNYTCHARFAAPALDPRTYFLAMTRSHPVPYAAYLDIGEAQIISLSPELLLEKRGERLRTKPMKGTRPRGRTLAEDEARRHELISAEKDRAENLMIVDMMRNDLGRLCMIGSVAVPALFSAEKYRSVWQMTTTVTGRLRDGIGLAEILAAILPGSSVTGAPKKRTMEIICQLEPEPRGIYCGAIGLFLPTGDFTLNLPIRTLVHRAGEFDLGIGAGIVWDSDPAQEYEETLLKAQFARRLAPDLRLFETLLVGALPSVFPAHQRPPTACVAPAEPPSNPAAPIIAYAEEHLTRLQQSAEYWALPFDREQARAALHACAKAEYERRGEPFVVRMELADTGEFSFACRPQPSAPSSPIRVLISDKHTSSMDRFLYHKTNQRALYEHERAKAAAAGYFDVLFCNEKGYLTESAIANLFVKRNGVWETPPLADGLLPGIWRADFISRVSAREISLTPEMLADAEEILLGNSVRGAIRVDEVVYRGRVLYRRRPRPEA